MPKTQKDIGCFNNSDTNTVTKEVKNKNPGTAVNDALSKAKTAARTEQLAFLNLHCPPNDDKDKRTCTEQGNKKGDEDEIELAVTAVVYDKAKKEWKATATATWKASFDCNEKKKKPGR